MIRVLVAGEGPNELGQPLEGIVVEGERPTGGGVIEALMAKVRPTRWQVIQTVSWKDVHKLQPNSPETGDARTVAILVLRAKEMGCHALVFLRDRDGSPSRERRVRDAAVAAKDPRVALAAGVPIEMLECWLLALRKEWGSQASSDPVQELATKHGVAAKSTPAMVQLVRNASLLHAPPDAVSLWQWLRRVAHALKVKPPAQWP
ncbi:MAG TPA: hypothetical protein VGG39_27580 [Polyangiaceae bacterium]|jgi:hypothetical protein